jgi:hypothetical protein
MGEENIAVYGGYANRLLKLQGELPRPSIGAGRGTASRSKSSMYIFTLEARGSLEL